MKTFKKSIFAAFAVVAGISLTTACSDANEYEDAYTDNPSWIENYTDSTKIAHPESLANTKWVRGTGIKQSAFGQEVQGFVESLDFVSADSVAVKMSQGTTTDGTWVDDSNTEKIPLYEYTYSATTGNIQILQRNVNKGQVTKTAIFVGVAVNGTWDVITLIHYGDTPVQTYLVKQ
jgi:hypothetical protein